MALMIITFTLRNYFKMMVVDAVYFHCSTITMLKFASALLVNVRYM